MGGTVCIGEEGNAIMTFVLGNEVSLEVVL